MDKQNLNILKKKISTKKKFEHLVKAIAIGKDISAIPPIPYSKRFQDFISKLIEC